MTNSVAAGPVPLEDASRAAVLNAEVAKYASKGWTVQTVSPGQAVLSQNKRIGWFWNLILCLVTGGLWLIVVIVRVVNRKKQSLIITVDQFGKVRTRNN
jgi:hypothetical protein